MPEQVPDNALGFCQGSSGIGQNPSLGGPQSQEKPGQDLSHLVVHGILHLIGYDHLTERDAAAMESLEIRILAELGVADPYRGTM